MSLSDLVCQDLVSFRKLAPKTASLHRKVAGNDRASADEKRRAFEGETDYRIAFRRAIKDNCYRYMAVLMQFDAQKPPPHHIISDDMLLQEIQQKVCPTKSVDRVACVQTLRNMEAAALQRGLDLKQKPRTLGYTPQYGNVPGQKPPGRTHQYGGPRDTPTPYKGMPEAPERRYQPVPERYFKAPDNKTGAPASTRHVSPLDVEPREIVLANAGEVQLALAATARLGAGVEVYPSLVQPRDGLYAERRFAAGDYVTEFAGEVVSYRRALSMLRGLAAGQVHTLRAGLWAVVGNDIYSEEAMGQGGGSFAASTLDVCASLAAGHELACEDVDANCELVLLNDAANAAASDDEYDVARVHLMLVATRDIAVSEQIFLDVVRLGDYGITQVE